jgi:hypothetical protein
MAFLTMEAPDFCCTASDERLLARFPCKTVVLLPVAPLPRSAVSLPDKP